MSGILRQLREQFQALVRHLPRKVSESPREAPDANDALARFWHEFKARTDTGEVRQRH
jgi:hypothetical protein